MLIHECATATMVWHFMWYIRILVNLTYIQYIDKQLH